MQEEKGKEYIIDSVMALLHLTNKYYHVQISHNDLIEGHEFKRTTTTQKNRSIMAENVVESFVTFSFHIYIYI